MNTKSFFARLLAPIAVALAMFTAIPASAECVSGPLCAPATTMPEIVNPVLLGMTVNFGGVNQFQGLAQVLEGIGGAGTDGNGAVVSDLALTFDGAGFCPDDPNCSDVGLTGSITSVGNSSAWAWAEDDLLAQTSGIAQNVSLLQLQVTLGDITPDATAE